MTGAFQDLLDYSFLGFVLCGLGSYYAITVEWSCGKYLGFIIRVFFRNEVDVTFSQVGEDLFGRLKELSTFFVRVINGGEWQDFVLVEETIGIF